MSDITPITGLSTWVYKLVFPLLWFGISIPLLLFGESRSTLDPATANALGWAFFMGFGALAAWMAWRLKSVTLIYDHLEIAGMFQQVRIPLREVTGIRVMRWYTLGGENPVSVSFAQPPPFLESMTFLPESDEALDALRAAWERARVEPRARRASMRGD